MDPCHGKWDHFNINRGIIGDHECYHLSTKRGITRGNEWWDIG